MSTLPPWADGLGLQSEVEKWQKECPADKDLLLWALQNQKLSSTEYVNWARNHYQLATVQSEFFTKLEEDKVWQETQTLFAWNNYLQPLAQWDETLFIGCLYPADFLRLDKEFQFLICDPKDLDQLWQKRHADAQPENLSSAVHLEAVDSHTPEGLSANLPSSAPDLPETMPEGFQQSEEKAASLDFGSLMGEKKAEATKEPEKAEVQPETPPPPPTMEEELDDLTPTPTHIQELSEVRENTATTKLANLMEKVRPSTSPKIKLPKNEMPGSIDIKSEESPLQSEDGSIDLRLVKQWKDIATYAFGMIDDFYEKSVLFISNKGKMTPIFWTSDWPLKEDVSNIPVNTADPSIFRIPFKSMKPFHGPISGNAINDNFFQVWNNSQNPEWISICPIIHENKVVGLLLGCLRDSSDDRLKLNKLEQLSGSLAMAVQHLSQQAS